MAEGLDYLSRILITSIGSRQSMAVSSGPAGPVLAGPVYMVIFGTVHAQIMKFRTRTAAPGNNSCSHHAAMATANERHKMISKKNHIIS